MNIKTGFSFIIAIQNWMDSRAGQTFLNYAYNWGAAVVILGTLFKLTHLSGANTLLFIGMGTEVFVFLISAFDRSSVFSKVREETRSSYSEYIAAPVTPDAHSEEIIKGYTKTMSEIYEKQIATMQENAVVTERIKEESVALEKNITHVNSIIGRVLNAFKAE